MAHRAQIRDSNQDGMALDGLQGAHLYEEVTRLRAENARLRRMMTGSRLVLRGSELVLERSRVLPDVGSLWSGSAKARSSVRPEVLTFRRSSL